MIKSNGEQNPWRDEIIYNLIIFSNKINIKIIGILFETIKKMKWV